MARIIDDIEKYLTSARTPPQRGKQGDFGDLAAELSKKKKIA